MTSESVSLRVPVANSTLPQDQPPVLPRVGTAAHTVPPDDLNGAYWRRHRSIDQTLLNMSLNLPDHLRIPSGLPDPNCIFLNMATHTSVICLHQAAIFKVDKNRLPASVGQESKIRCVSAAAEIANIMRAISHCDLGTVGVARDLCLTPPTDHR